ncbi:MAG: tyrosine-type recombinase/integrase [Candidatus Bathyarchaeia archaeon]|jgi:integrase
MATKEFRGQPIKDLKGYMTEQQVKKLIDSATRPDFKMFLRLLWVTGARVSEILGDKSWYKERIYNPAKVNDVLFDEGIIILNLLKRKQYPPPQHRVALDKITLQNLKDYILTEKLKPNDPLFKFSRGTAFYLLRKLGNQIGIIKVGAKKLHNHHFRHSHCVAYIRKNNTMEGLRKLQEQIGHASISTTAGYLQFGEEAQKEAEDVFGKW